MWGRRDSGVPPLHLLGPPCQCRALSSPRPRGCTGPTAGLWPGLWRSEGWVSPGVAQPPNSLWWPASGTEQTCLGGRVAGPGGGGGVTEGQWVSAAGGDGHPCSSVGAFASQRLAPPPGVSHGVSLPLRMWPACRLRRRHVPVTEQHTCVRAVVWTCDTSARSLCVSARQELPGPLLCRSRALPTHGRGGGGGQSSATWPRKVLPQPSVSMQPDSVPPPCCLHSAPPAPGARASPHPTAGTLGQGRVNGGSGS